jgi:hypothetical protein
MEPQDSHEFLSLIAASLGGLICIVAGLTALFIGLKSQGALDLTVILKGRLTTGIIGLLLVFVGSLLVGAVVFYETTLNHTTITLPNGAKETIVVGRNFKLPPPAEMARIMKEFKDEEFKDEVHDIQHATPTPAP